VIRRHQLEGGFRGKQWSATASIAIAVDGLDLDPSAFSQGLVDGKIPPGKVATFFLDECIGGDEALCASRRPQARSTARV